MEDAHRAKTQTEPNGNPDGTQRKPSLAREEGEGELKNSSPLPLSSGAPTTQDLEDAFNDLWEVYPRKSGKGDAKRAFFRVVREEGVAPATIFYAVMEQSKSPDWTADDGKFVPSLTKWLDGGRWDDVLSAPQEKKMAAPPAQPDPYEYRGPLSPDEIWGDAAQRAAAVAAATGRTPTDV